MIARLRSGPRLPLWVLPPALALAAAVVVVFAQQGTGQVEVFERGIVAMAAVAGIVIAMCVSPAWPLSLGIALSAFSGHWGDFGLPLPFDRVFLLTGIVSTLVRARAASPTALRVRPIDVLLGVVALYAVMSAWAIGTLQIPDARFALLDRFTLLGFALFFVAPKAFWEERDRRVLIGVLVGTGLYLGITAFFEEVGPDALVWPNYIKDPTIGTHSDRARGPFAEAGANGIAMFGCLVAAALAFTMWRSRRARALALLVVGLCGLGILFTVTRAAWIGAGAGAVIGLLAARETRRYAVPAVGAAVLGIVVALAVIPGLADKAISRKNDERPIWDRKNSNAAALRMIEDKPAFGHGWASFQYLSGPYYRQSPDFPLSFVGNLHNVYLSNAVELGLVGGLLWLFGCAAALGGAVIARGPPELRPWKLTLAALIVAVGLEMASTPFSFALPLFLLWTWAGIARGDSEDRRDHALARAPVLERAEARREPLVGAGIAR